MERENYWHKIKRTLSVLKMYQWILQGDETMKKNVSEELDI